MSYLTEDELMMIQLLPTGSPYVIRHASQTQFSIARHYGGMKYQGEIYTYFPATDELIRDDVLRMVSKQRRKDERTRNAKQADNQLSF